MHIMLLLPFAPGIVSFRGASTTTTLPYIVMVMCVRASLPVLATASQLQLGALHKSMRQFLSIQIIRRKTDENNCGTGRAYEKSAFTTCKGDRSERVRERERGMHPCKNSAHIPWRHFNGKWQG